MAQAHANNNNKEKKMSSESRVIPVPRRGGSFLYVIVDAEDYDWACQYKWRIDRDGYACRIDKIDDEKRAKRMHRELLAPPDGILVTHINGNRLDNRRCNLRLMTVSEMRATASVRKDANSGCKGVTPFRNRWRARVGKDGKSYCLGLFATKEEAVAARNEAARQLYGRI